MSPEDALNEVRDAYADVLNQPARRLRLGRAFAAARDAGNPQTALVEETGYNREQIRRLTLAARTVDNLPDGYTAEQLQDAFVVLASASAGEGAVAAAYAVSDIPAEEIDAAYLQAKVDSALADRQKVTRRRSVWERPAGEVRKF